VGKRQGEIKGGGQEMAAMMLISIIKMTSTCINAVIFLPLLIFFPDFFRMPYHFHSLVAFV